MITAGKYHELTVSKISDFGLYLADDQENEVLLPNRFVSLTDQVGDKKRLFVYHDSEDRLVASTEDPLAQVGEVALLRAVDKTIHGAFLDWGLAAKHLFVPNRNMKIPMETGRSYVVYIYTDHVTGRTVATAKLNGFINNEDITSLKVGDKVDIVVAQRVDLGFRVVINNAHWGIIYHNQVFRTIDIGNKMEGFVAKISEDNRIDISLQRGGFGGVRDGSDDLLSLIILAGGSLPIHDDSTPDEIASITSMSKKGFKRAAGHLMKIGRVEMSAEGIKIKQQ